MHDHPTTAISAVSTVAPIARRGRVPVIAFSNDVAVAGDGVYVMGFTPGQSIERVVDFARGRGATRFAALVPEGVYGTRASQAMVTRPCASGSPSSRSGSRRCASVRCGR